jgi:hypothetical protein
MTRATLITFLPSPGSRAARRTLPVDRERLPKEAPVLHGCTTALTTLSPSTSARASFISSSLYTREMNPS